MVAEAKIQKRPAVLAWQGKQYLMQLEGIVPMAQRPIRATRSWALGSAEPPVSKQELQQPFMQQHKQEEGNETASASSELTLSVAQIAQVVLLISSGMERSKAIRSMPGYSYKHRKQYAALYDQLREALNTAPQLTDAP